MGKQSNIAGDAATPRADPGPNELSKCAVNKQNCFRRESCVDGTRGGTPGTYVPKSMDCGLLGCKEPDGGAGSRPRLFREAASPGIKKAENIKFM